MMDDDFRAGLAQGVTRSVVPVAALTMVAAITVFSVRLIFRMVLPGGVE